MEQIEQIEQAVNYALDPQADPRWKAEANAYCEHVKNAPEGWKICLELFVKEPKSNPMSRFFALQVLENTLQNRYDLDPSALEFIRQKMIEYLVREFIDNHKADSEQNYIRDKAIQILTLLLVRLYPSSWSSFFTDLSELVQKQENIDASTKAVDFFLRLCLSINEEIAGHEFTRSSQEAKRSTQIKDAMRMGDVQRLVSFWHQCLVKYHDSNPTIVKLALKNIGGYIAWMDISLVANGEIMSALFAFLKKDNLRTDACDCWAEVISKKMSPFDKLSLIRMTNLIALLNLTNTPNGLVLPETDSDIDFVKSVAHLTNTLGTELCRICLEDGAPSEVQAEAWTFIEQLSIPQQTPNPPLLLFLANEFDDVSTVVFPFVNDIMAIFKKKKKQGQAFTSTQQELMQSLLKKIFEKMKYDIDTDFDDEEDEALFADMRKNLQIFSEHVATINEELYTQHSFTSVMTTLTKYESGEALDWPDVELCLYMLYIYGEALRKSDTTFIVNDDPNSLTRLGQMVAGMVKSNISFYNHPVISLQFFENIWRYNKFFEQRPDYLGKALEMFVSPNGLHHSSKKVQLRCWYLFQRFVKELKPKLGPYIDSVLTSMGDLLMITAEPQTEAMDDASAPAASTFDSQLYLFEAVGNLISVDTLDPMKQTQYLTIVLEPLAQEIGKSVSQGYNPEDELRTLQLHHHIAAIGSVAKGFKDIPKQAVNAPNITLIFTRSLEIILEALKVFSQAKTIREAARFSFSRLVTCLGTSILPCLETLISALLTESQVDELVDILPFIGRLAHEFKPNINNVIDELFLSLVKRVTECLEATPSGTDEAILLHELHKAYTTFILNLFKDDVHSVMLSDRNVGYLNTVLHTLLRIAIDNQHADTQKLAFAIFYQIVKSWGAVPQIAEFTYQELISATFKIPLSSSFNVTDGQSLLIFGEIAGVQKLVYSQQGDRYIEYMLNAVFPSICERDVAEQYCTVIREYDDRAFKKFFQSFIQQVKR